MPSWSNFDERERWQLVAYIKTFAPRFESEQTGEPIAIGTPKLPLPASVQNGRRLYIEAECWACHGMTGAGDGPSAPTLTDDWGHPIVPADLRLSSNWRGGSRHQDIFRSIAVAWEDGRFEGIGRVTAFGGLGEFEYAAGLINGEAGGAFEGA